jgi:hypothetical protein
MENRKRADGEQRSDEQNIHVEVLRSEKRRKIRKKKVLMCNYFIVFKM